MLLTNETTNEINDLSIVINSIQSNNIFVIVNNTNEKDICDILKLKNIYRFDFELKYYKITFNEYVPNKIEKPSWVFSDKALINFYYQDEKIKIIIIEGLENNWNLLDKLKNNMYVFILLPIYYDKYKFKFMRDVIYSQQSLFNIKNIIIMCSDLDNMLLSCEYNFSYLLLNQNSLLDYSIFSLLNSEKKYDLVINTRPEKWKRPYLAKKIKNLAIIKGYNFRKNDIYDLNELSPIFINNDNRLTPEEVNTIYSQSYCGGIFSESEGACYSSSEYLLSGLPVISTKSKGGRDIWYTSHNSIIVEPTEESIYEAVILCKQKILSGEFDPVLIRNEHIKMSNEMRNDFIEFVQNIFDVNNISIKSLEYWNKNYYNKMRQTMKLQEALNIISK